MPRPIPQAGLATALVTGGLVILSALLVVPGSARAQSTGTVSGAVRDADTNQPLPGVNVFLAYTQLGAATDSTGTFRISGIPTGSYELVVSMVSYQTHTLPVSVAAGSERDVSVRLEPTLYAIDGLEVTAERDRRWQGRFDTFTRLFVGTSANAAHTEILNPFVLNFESENQILTATAAEPLQIENRSLGYRLTFVLESFRWDPHAKRLQFSGKPFFEPLVPAGPDEALAWEEYRARTYQGSLRHLIRSIIDDQVFDEGFLLHHDRRLNAPLQPSTSMDMTPMRPDDLLQATARSDEWHVSFSDYLRVIYRKKRRNTSGPFRRNQWPEQQVSWLRMNRAFAIVHEDGTVQPWDAFQLYGDLWDRRVADLLPRTYGRVDDPPLVAQAVQMPPARPPLHVELVHFNNTAFVADEYRGTPAQPRPAALQDALEAMRAERWDRAAHLLDRFLDRQPNHPEARYLDALCRREQVKIFPEPGLWRGAIHRFEDLIARDSLYRDVLYQYAILRRYAEELEPAIELGHAQVRLRPELTHARVGLFNLYDHLVHVRDPDEALAWLEAHPSDHAAYARAEVLRLDGRLEEAETALHSLLSRPDLALPRQPAYLSLARILYARNQPEVAQRYVRQAIDEIDGDLAATLVFEDAKYIATDEEWAAFRSLTTPDAYVAFFQTFWTKRDPTPGRAENVRLTEHYRRLHIAERDYAHYGQRLWHTDPDASAAFDHPAVYRLNDAFNDKGLIYIRHGEPDDRITTVSPYSEGTSTQAGVGIGHQPADDMNLFRVREDLPGVPSTQRPDGAWVPNESWRYYPAGTGPDNPPMDFHFVVAGGGSNWRLTPRLRNVAMAVDREHWGGSYARIAREARTFLETKDRLQVDPNAFTQNRMDATLRQYNQAVDDVAETSRDAAARGLATDRHSWGGDLTPLDVPFLSVVSRADDGHTTLDLYYALQNGYITEQVEPEGDELDLEIGLALHDLRWRPQLEQAEVVSHPTSDDPANSLINKLSLSAPPDSYHVAFHVHPLGSDLLGAYQFDQALPDFNGPDLMMSDLLPAYLVEVEPGVVPDDRSDLRIVANPFRRFALDEPLYVVFDLYNLALDADDRTDYTLDYTLTPVREGNAVTRLLRADRPSLSLKTNHAGTSTAPVEFAQIDASRVAPGRYLLTVEASDRVRNRRVAQTRLLELVR